MIVSIFGPTAVGKSRVAAGVACEIGGEVVSADSMQVYRGLSILTDQPDSSLLAMVPHHLVAHVGLDENYSAARFAREAEAAIGQIQARGATPVLAGGTGLYIRSVAAGLDFPAKADEDTRVKWEQFIEEEGLDAALEELDAMDPEAAAAIDRRNPRRVIRALELAETGIGSGGRSDRLWSAESRYETLSFGLDLERQELYRRIDRRVSLMFKRGVVDEVEKARRGTVSRAAAQAIGFRVLCRYLDGEMTLEQAADRIRQDSRRYAKRQLTWMRKMPDIARIDLTGSSTEAAVDEIVDHVKSRQS